MALQVAVVGAQRPSTKTHSRGLRGGPQSQAQFTGIVYAPSGVPGWLLVFCFAICWPRPSIPLRTLLRMV